MGPLIPLYRTSGDVSSRFQSQSGQPLFVSSGGTCVTFSLKFSSGVTPADVLVASMTVEPFLFHLPAGRHFWGSITLIPGREPMY